MNSLFDLSHIPSALPKIETKTQELGFNMASDYKTGALLKMLAASKPGGRFLELGTGTGFGSAWILSGMDQNATLLSVDNNPEVSAVAATHLGTDSRLSLVVGDAAEVISTAKTRSFDLIFADAWVGKFDLLEETLALVAPGGFYIIDDLLPQPNWPENHEPRIPILLKKLQSHPGFTLCGLEWSTGIVIATHTNSLFPHF